MPLCTILTKWPAPFSPTQSQQGVPSSTLAQIAWKDRLYVRPCGRTAAGHHAGAFQSAFLAAGHAGADVEKALRLDIRGAANGVGEVTVAAVDENVARLQQRNQLLDHFIHCAAGLDHHEDFAGLFQIRRQFLKTAAADNGLSGCAAGYERIDLRDRAVVHRDSEALRRHVHDEVFSHDGKPNQADICFFHVLPPYRAIRALPAQMFQTCSSFTGLA
jgi:hypothetical protein